MQYGYARISLKEQSIERQIRNIKNLYPDALILAEAFTGTKMERPEWKKLYAKAKAGDAIIFDSVSRMSRTAEEGVQTYFVLYERGVSLFFLKEPLINTDVYSSAIEQSIPKTGNEIADIYIEATNKVLRLVAERQIEAASMRTITGCPRFQKCAKYWNGEHKNTVNTVFATYLL